MLIVIKLFAEDQSEFDSSELDSPTSSSSELEEQPEESELDDESLLGANTSERTPFVSDSESCFLCNIVCLLPFLPLKQRPGGGGGYLCTASGWGHALGRCQGWLRVPLQSALTSVGEPSFEFGCWSWGDGGFCISDRVFRLAAETIPLPQG